jgi:UDP-N-acetylmuramate dehydrogenase
MNKSKAALPILENVPLAPYTTLGVGGPARFLIKAKTREQILDALEFARARSCQIFVLGGGSNIVVSDSGFSGLVLKIELVGIQPLDHENSGRFSVEAGVEWDSFVQHSVNRNLGGIECLSGIPGTVGGAPIQNIGAYGEDVSEVISRVQALDRDSNRITELTNVDCRFTYRSGIFNTTHKDRYIILSVDFSLRTDGVPRIDYPELQKQFEGSAHTPSISDVREAVLHTRQTKAMVLQDGDPDTRSVGSFFKNPVLSLDDAARIEMEARSKGLLGPYRSVPQFAASPGKVKWPAAWLIEHAGIGKGFVHKNTGVSSKHALALINRGGATAQDILELMGLIQDRVQGAFGVRLQPEPIFVGFENSIQESEVRKQNSEF